MLEKEDFQAWREQAATRWVLERLKAEATEWAGDLKDQLYQMASSDPLAWQAQQVQAAYLRGLCEARIGFAALEYDELLTEEEKEKLKDE